jgi:hypothetical protein
VSDYGPFEGKNTISMPPGSPITSVTLPSADQATRGFRIENYSGHPVTIVAPPSRTIAPGETVTFSQGKDGWEEVAP